MRNMFDTWPEKIQDVSDLQLSGLLEMVQRIVLGNADINAHARVGNTPYTIGDVMDESIRRLTPGHNADYLKE